MLVSKGTVDEETKTGKKFKTKKVLLKQSRIKGVRYDEDIRSSRTRQSPA